MAAEPRRAAPQPGLVNLIDYLGKCLKVEPLTSRHFHCSFLLVNFDSELRTDRGSGGNSQTLTVALEK